MSHWFSHDRFGMFIHWGPYAVTGGKWKGMTVPWISEWIMRKFQIPVKEYEDIAANFNPVNFDADKWVAAAKDAGMRYIVFTAKHHDGFAMFKSTYDRYNIVDWTPFGRDVLAELADACRRHGIRLGCYYSQDQDWHEEGASGNTWDFPVKTPEKFQAYLDGKVKHQLREILSNYGEISIIWFDTPATVTAAQSQDLKDYVHSFQPDCLVSGRVGNGLGDYISLGDNQLPESCFDTLAEGIGTMNDSWGHRSDDDAYKPPKDLLRILGKMIAHNANYMLNVGPRGNGVFTCQAKSTLNYFRDRMNNDKFARAVYGAGDVAKILPCVPYHWGEATSDGDRKVWLWVFNNVSKLKFFGIITEVEKVVVVKTGRELRFSETHVPEYKYHRLVLEKLPFIRKPYLIEITLKGKLEGYPGACGATR